MWTPENEADYTWMKGSQVVTADGVTIGEVAEIIQNHPNPMPGITGTQLLVRPGAGSPLAAATYVPNSAISAVTNGQVTLLQTAAELPAQPWPTTAL